MKLHARILRRDDLPSNVCLYDIDSGLILSIQGGLLFIDREEKRKKISSFVAIVENIQKAGIEVSGLEEILAEFYKPTTDTRIS